ncbi:EF-hand domain-containing protein [Halomonas sp. N3-2A]|uniref:EF-hand domain-containing protein n=1 Tax=Halomonas sp. N3-2A TaxID=2014541 RepID=UPI000B5B2B61|nr:EF-hand domain-containing protein [Halomonas sp. N3-2A]ASK18372.1 hypothetical protein CEK60_03205 [Halomonas sp. N3-2A]
MSYNSTLHIAIDSTGAEQQLKRFQNRLELTDRAGDEAASSVSNVGLEADRMRNTIMRASGALAGSAAALGLMARQSSDAAREIKNLSRLAGADVVTFQKMTMASRAFGIEQEQLAQIMLDVKDRVGDFLQTGQGEFADFFENIAPKVGLTADALARMAGPEALQAIYNALEQTNLTASETTFYMESLASDATRLIPLLQDNGAGFREVANEAERLGVALSEVEIDQLVALRGEFADLETIISSSTSQIIAEYSGEITSTVDALGDGVRLLADNFDNLADAATLAAGVMTARFVSAMAAGTAATIHSMAVTRAQTLALAENQAVEASRTATMARSVAAEQSSAAARANIAAQRASQNAAAIAQDLQRVQSLQSTLAAERTLAAQRLQSQTTAAGRMQVQARIAQLQTAETAATNQLALASGRLTQAQTAEASAKRTAALASLDKARADTAATAAMGRYTAAAAAATGASTALATASRAASGALTLVGGPVGAAVLATVALGALANRLDKTAERAENMEFRANELASSLQSMGETSIRTQLAAVTLELASMDGAQEALNETARRSSRAHSTLGADLRNLGDTVEVYTRANQNSTEEVEKMRTQQMALEKALELISGSSEAATRAINEYGESAEDAADKTYTLADAYESLLDRIKPNRREARQYAQDLGALNLALASGRMNTQQYMQAMGLLQESFQAVQRDTDELSKKTADETKDMSREWERFGNSVDDALVDIVKGSFDSFDNIGDAFETLIAEMIVAAGKNEIRLRLGMGTSGPMQGGFSQLLGMGKSDGLGSLISGGKTLLGLSTPAAASGTALSGGFMGAAATQSAGSLYGMATTGGVAQAGLASSIAAGISTAMPWIAGGLAIDSLLGGGITKAISGLFGGKSRGPSFDLMTTNQDPRTIFEDVQHGVSATGAFGNIGFHGGNTNRLEETFGSFDNARQYLEVIAATDDMMAALSPKDVEAMTYAIQQMRIKSSDAAGITEQLGDRTKAAFGAMSGDFGAFARTLSGSTEEIIAQAQNARQAHDLLTGASERLGVQFNATGGYSYEVANGMAAMAGGVQSLESMYSSFYQNYYTEAERTAQKTDDVTAAFAALGFAMPENAAQFRELVLAQDTSTEAGRAAQVELLRLESAFAQLTPAIEDTGSAADTASEALRMQGQLNRQLLQAQGDTGALRQLEIDALKEIQGWQEAGLVATQKRIWAIEDEKEAQREAERAQQERIRAIEQEASAWQRAQQQLASFGVSIDKWVDNLRGTDAGLGTPGDQLAAASAAFDEQYAKALSGDQAALGSITQYADRFIEAQKGWSASGEQTVSTIDRVTGMLEKLPDQLTPEQFLAEEFKGIIDGQTTALLSGWNGGFDSLLSGLSADFGALDTSLDGLLSFDELKAGLAGKATDSELRALIGAVDKNGDGLISKQELTNASISDLRVGITSTLSKSFSDLDSNVDGLLTFAELKAGLGGIATDETLRAMMHGMDLNNDGVINKLESIVIAEMPNDAVLTTVLKNKMDALGSKTLTAAQVKQALSPIASDEDIAQLIKRVDKNGDGIISAEELTAARVGGLAQGITDALLPAFGELDKNVDGLLTLSELQTGLKGIATNDAIRGIFAGADLNNDNVINKLESVVIAGMPTDARLTTVLRNQMQDLRTKTLTAQQVRSALSPIASNDVIDQLIRQVDTNGDGIISAEENTAARVAGLTDGIAGALEPMFNSIDLDASGLIDYNEFGKVFDGMATDEQLKNIFSELDKNGDGVISKLEAMHRSTMDAEGSIKTIEDFFYRAGSPSWGLRVSMSHHQNVDAVKSFGYHTAKEMRREFSPSGTGIGVSLAAPQNGDGARSIATAFKQVLGANSVNGSHADGLWNVGFDGYIAELHKDEMVVPAGPANALRELAAGDPSMSMASMPAPAVTMSAPPVPQFPLLDQTDVTQVMRDMQRTIEMQGAQIAELLRTGNRNTEQTKEAVVGVGKAAHRQREEHGRKLDRLNSYIKLRVRT